MLDTPCAELEPLGSYNSTSPSTYALAKERSHVRCEVGSRAFTPCWQRAHAKG